MKVAAIVLSVPLILEFVFAPVNLWTGRTIDNFVRFTGFDPPVARTWLAPLKLATAGLLTAGLAIRGLSLLGFGLFGPLAAALLVIRIIQA